MQWPTVTTILVLALSSAGARCPDTPPVKCKEESPRWRSIDGSCNNARDPTLGMANTPLIRILRDQYADGVHLPRVGVAGSALPSPRVLVTELFADKNVPSLATNQLVMNWAQLVSHDVSRIQAPFPSAGSRCCAALGSASNVTDTCARIDVPAKDPFYSQFGVRCLGMTRSTSAPCKHAAHEQKSVVTHYMDASFVYGSSEATTRRLREGRGGRLRAQFIDGEEFLPRNSNGNQEAGDGRVTITPMLASLQTLFLREHNRVARVLASTNPGWSDERTFQESRRVLVAQWQLLTYRDWLQWIIGTDTVQRSGLLPSSRSFSRDYDERTDPSTANDFTSAAYRSFHSMIPNDVWFGGLERGMRLERVPLSGVGADAILQKARFRRSVMGMVIQPRQTQDQFMAEEITNKLFRGANPFGGDLVSTDIARGREHGLPGYNDYRAHCNMTRATKFSDFGDTIDAQNIAKLRRLYAHPDDVDFVVGGLLEQLTDTSPLASVTSPVFRCIVVDQFRRWKRGDRFFFDLGGPAPGFTEAQLRQLSKQTMSRLICDNVPDTRAIPNDVFLRLGVLGNKQVACKDLPRIDFSAWRENKAK